MSGRQAGPHAVCATIESTQLQSTEKSHLPVQGSEGISVMPENETMGMGQNLTSCKLSDKEACESGGNGGKDGGWQLYVSNVFFSPFLQNLGGLGQGRDVLLKLLQ